MGRRLGISTPVISERGAMPIKIVLDNGPELTSRALGQWAYWRGVRLRSIRSVKACPERSHRELQRAFPSRLVAGESSA